MKTLVSECVECPLFRAVYCKGETDYECAHPRSQEAKPWDIAVLLEGKPDNCPLQEEPLVIEAISAGAG